MTKESPLAENAPTVESLIFDKYHSYTAEKYEESTANRFYVLKITKSVAEKFVEQHCLRFPGHPWAQKRRMRVTEYDNEVVWSGMIMEIVDELESEHGFSIELRK